MRTFTQLKLFGTNLTTNTAASNNALIGDLINEQYRFMLENYFDNERTAYASTVGQSNLTLTGSLSIGATSATLTASWTQPSCMQYVNFSGGQQRPVNFTNGSTTITWTTPLTATATTAITALGIQDYLIPANVSKIKDNTINVGQQKFTPVEVKTRQEWDLINFLPYNSDIPNYYFIWNNRLSIFPIPSTTGNVITFNYKTRVADLSYEDYSTGTLAAGGMTVGSTSVTGLATSWLTTANFPANTDISFLNLCIKADTPYGDGIWYPIQSFQSNTTLTLVNPVINAPNITAATTYTIGQIPILQEDFHQSTVYGALKTYFSTIVDNPNKYKEFKDLYEARMKLLADYADTKSVQVDLGQEPNLVNPNLFIYAPNN